MNALLDRMRAFGRFLWRRFRDDRCFETAGALSFTTLFAIVPLLAAVFAMMAVFPAFAYLRDKLTEFIFRNFVPGAGVALQEYLLKFADNASQLTIVGVLVLLFTALMLMANIEETLNRIWRVPVPRKGSSRLLMYWAAVTLGPVLVVVSVAASSWVLAQPLLRQAEDGGMLGPDVIKAVPFLVTWLALTLLYELVPNTRVRWRDALLGALLAAVAFEVARWGFTLYVTSVANYHAIYGTLAVIPIFMIWVFLSWVIVLLAATVTATLTAFEYRPRDELLPPGCEFVGLLRVLQHFAQAQRAGEGIDERALAQRERFLTVDLLQRYLGNLREAGLIQRGESGAWILARDLDSVYLDDLYRIGGYRLPTDMEVLEAASDGLAPLAREVLLRAAADEREHLAHPLRSLFVDPPVVVQRESRA